MSFDWQYADQKGVDHFVLAAFVESTLSQAKQVKQALNTS